MPQILIGLIIIAALGGLAFLGSGGVARVSLQWTNEDAARLQALRHKSPQEWTEADRHELDALEGKKAQSAGHAEWTEPQVRLTDLLGVSSVDFFHAPQQRRRVLFVMASIIAPIAANIASGVLDLPRPYNVRYMPLYEDISLASQELCYAALVLVAFRVVQQEVGAIALAAAFGGALRVLGVLVSYRHILPVQHMISIAIPIMLGDAVRLTSLVSFLRLTRSPALGLFAGVGVGKLLAVVLNTFGNGMPGQPSFLTADLYDALLEGAFLAAIWWLALPANPARKTSVAPAGNE